MEADLATESAGIPLTETSPALTEVTRLPAGGTAPGGAPADRKRVNEPITSSAPRIQTLSRKRIQQLDVFSSSCFSFCAFAGDLRTNIKNIHRKKTSNEPEPIRYIVNSSSQIPESNRHHFLCQLHSAFSRFRHIPDLGKRQSQSLACSLECTVEICAV